MFHINPGRTIALKTRGRHTHGDAFDTKPNINYEKLGGISHALYDTPPASSSNFRSSL